MMTVNVHQAKTQISRLLARVESGEDVMIARALAHDLILVSVDKNLDRYGIKRLW